MLQVSIHISCERSLGSSLAKDVGGGKLSLQVLCHNILHIDGHNVGAIRIVCLSDNGIVTLHQLECNC